MADAKAVQPKFSDPTEGLWDPVEILRCVTGAFGTNVWAQKPPPGMAYIYRLRDEETGKTRYIGSTIKPLGKRLKDHFLKSPENGHKLAWIRGHKSRTGRISAADCIGLAPCTGRYQVETEATLYYKAAGSELLNLTIGGKAPYHAGGHLSASHKRSLSESQLRRFRKPEEIEKLRVSHRKPWSYNQTVAGLCKNGKLELASLVGEADGKQ